jgi:hypothetical protein
MAFTYDFTSAPTLSMVRLLVGDTVEVGHIWEDAEINAVLQMESSQGLFISLTGYSVVPPQVYSVRRAAAALLDGLASQRGRLGAALSVLDIKIDLSQAAKSLRDTAQSLRDTEAESGAFAIAEMVENNFTMRERFWNQIARQAA